MIPIAELLLILTQNIVFSYALGIPNIAKSAVQRRMLLLSGLLVAIFVTLNTVLLALIRPLLSQTDTTLILPLCCVALNGVLDLILLILIAAVGGMRARTLIPHLHATAFSGAVLGSLLLSYNAANTPLLAAKNGLRCGLGYFLVCCMLALAAPALHSEKMPAAVRGWRGMFLYIGVIAMAVACISAGLES